MWLQLPFVQRTNINYQNRATHVINESIAIYGLYYCELQIRSLLTAIAGITKLI
ncbi:MAG: hypothetical protein HC785_16135 [Calothrix sp. CSU_2_0]|nr:hypothetical protein [Calothrix sp. CSU_2_0]